MLRLTRAQVREIDRLAIEQYLIPGIVLMENASRNAADLAYEMLRGETDGQVLILCGGGNNGGDGLAIARHLHNRGFEISIALTTDAKDYKGDALINFNIAREIGLPIAPADVDHIRASKAKLIIDAIFGTGLNRPPREPFGQIVEAVQSSRKPVLAIDVPSGLDCDTGEPLGECIEATQTITFVAEKVGFANPAARKYLGKITVGDIGCPRELVEKITDESIKT
ncbi:MAG TPA: NAD(P)H-hydrate epimerase [Tepidisphaeraceae bacterium]|jgi:NAD(P)H-hydrate epimerase|nr:NAD(P)H-hydrate epimerase [Tepidisphaeraceae bacterium]